MLNRIDNIAASATPASADIYARYAYLAAGTIVRVSRPSQADGLTLDYDPDADHTYSGWDRFGRVGNQQWTTTTGGIVDQYRYGYDIAGNRTTRTNALNAALTETYTYDELSRLIDTDRGEGQQQVNFESWQLDQLGNWMTFCGPIQDPNNPQTRLHNEANEITSIDSSSAQVAYDAAGNMIRMPSALNQTQTHHAVYDAWNRMTAVYLDDGDGTFEPTGENADTLIATYDYDGQRRRIVEVIAATSTTRDTYFNENWQGLETRIDSSVNPQTQYVMDLRYIDSVIVRFHDANSDGDYLDEGDNVLYYTNDANFNVTALVAADTGDVVERYAYEGYGNQTVLEADWSPDADNASDFANEIQYAGYRFDPESGLYHVRNRPYDAPLGRFIARDFEGYIDGMSLYEYCASGPMDATDAAGLAMIENYLPVPESSTQDKPEVASKAWLMEREKVAKRSCSRTLTLAKDTGTTPPPIPWHAFASAWTQAVNYLGRWVWSTPTELIRGTDVTIDSPDDMVAGRVWVGSEGTIALVLRNAWGYKYPREHYLVKPIRNDIIARSRESGNISTTFSGATNWAAYSRGDTAEGMVTYQSALGAITLNQVTVRSNWNVALEQKLDSGGKLTGTAMVTISNRVEDLWNLDDHPIEKYANVRWCFTWSETIEYTISGDCICRTK